MYVYMGAQRRTTQYSHVLLDTSHLRLQRTKFVLLKNACCLTIGSHTKGSHGECFETEMPNTLVSGLRCIIYY